MDKFRTIPINLYTFLPELLKWILRTLELYSNIKVKNVEKNESAYRIGKYKIHCTFYNKNSVTIFVDMENKNITVFSVDYQINKTTKKTSEVDKLLKLLYVYQKKWKQHLLVDIANPIKLSKIVRS